LQFLPEIDAILGRVNGRIADHGVGNAEGNVDRGDVDETEGNLMSHFPFARFDLLLGDSRVVKRNDELAVGVVVVCLIELHLRIRQGLLCGRQFTGRDDTPRV
jgi:hypothetical protein